MTHPPRPISLALEAVLAAMRDRGGFAVLPGMRLEVVWIQKRQCYQVLVEFRFADDPEPSTTGPIPSFHRQTFEKT